MAAPGIAFSLAVLSCTMTAATVQQSAIAQQATVTTVDHPFTSPTGRFTITVPAQWTTETEEGTSEVVFHRGAVSVTVSDDEMPADKPVESYLQLGQMMLKQSCPTAVVKSEGAQTVAGTPGSYFLMRCEGPPGQPTDVRMAAAYSGGRLYAFSTTVLTKYVDQVQPVFDAMAGSFHAMPNETAAQKKARYDAAEKNFAAKSAQAKKLCADGTINQADCAAMLAHLQAERGAAEEGSTSTAGQVITVK